MSAAPRSTDKAKRPVLEAEVEDLGHDGRGVARADGKAVFLHGALPGERVEYRRTRRRRSHDEGEVTAVLTASAERVTPPCPFYARCGGCRLQHLAPERQIVHKQDLVLDNLARLGGVHPERILEPVTGPQWGYRRKARLGVKDVPGKGRVLVGFRERGKPYVVDMSHCPVLAPVVGERIEALSELIGRLGLRRRVPQIEVAVGDDDAALVFRVLAEPDENDRAAFADFAERHGLQVFLQPGGPDSVYPLRADYPPLSYRLPEHGVEIRFAPLDFTQINAEVNRALVDRAVELLAPRPDERVLDLFCGLGNLTLPAARQAGEAVGVDGDAGLVERAADNARHNRTDNARFYTGDLQQPATLTETPWLAGRYDGVLLDPPRSGAREVLRAVAEAGADRMVYVSCHPGTLARDAGTLVRELGYRLTDVGVLDMFPHTAHVEAVARFERG